MRLVNLTPHEINIYTELNLTPTTSIKRSGMVAVVETEQRHSFWLADGVEVVETVWRGLFVQDPDGKRTLFPEPETGVVYVVSRMVKDRLPGRDDVLSQGLQ